MSEPRAVYVTATSPTVTPDSVTLITSAQWARLLTEVQSGLRHDGDVVIVRRYGGHIEIGKPIAFESCYRQKSNT